MKDTWLYMIGTAFTDNRRAYHLVGPMTAEDANRFEESNKDQWYCVAWQRIDPRFWPEAPKLIANRRGFYLEAMLRLARDDAFCGGCHGQSQDLRELEAWAIEYGVDRPPTPSDKVEPFWWEGPHGESKVDSEAAWRATLALCGESSL